MDVAKFARQLSLVILILSLLFLGAVRFTDFFNVKSEPITVIPKIVPTVENEFVTLAFVGDLMLDRGVKYMVNKYFDSAYAELFSKVETRLQDYDFLFGNLEGPVSEKGTDQGGIYSFRMSPKILPVLKNAGFDLFSLANNHIYNWGPVAFEDTLGQISLNNLKYSGGGFSGPETYSGASFDIAGVKITLLSFSEFTAGGISSTSTKSGIATISEDNIKNFVSEAKLRSDLVIVSFHFGEEYQKIPNDYQIKHAHLAVDSGADLIIGHHPHVVQTLEQYKNSFIIYSLGNFIFDQYFSPETMNGGLLEVKVNVKSKKIENVTLKKVSLNKFYQIESIE